MIKYDVVCDTDYADFHAAVRDFLADGWKLQGGVSVSSSAVGRFVFAQAMIKEETND